MTLFVDKQDEKKIRRVEKTGLGALSVDDWRSVNRFRAIIIQSQGRVDSKCSSFTIKK